MGVASERAVSIPQITYDHINDTEEKKDVAFFQDGKRGSVEGNAIPAWARWHHDTTYFRLLRTRLDFHKHRCMLSFWSTVGLPVGHMKSLSPVSSSADLILHLINILLWIWHLRISCSLRSVLFHTHQGHLASKLVSHRGRSVPVTKQMTNARLFPLIGSDDVF